MSEEMNDELLIREFEESDYPHLVRLEKSVYPDSGRSVESYRFGDENRAEKCKHQRYIAEREGEVIGHGFYSQWESSYDPHKFFVYLLIHPDYQGNGYGSRFYRYIIKELEKFDPTVIQAHAREDKERGVKFIEDRGFEETMRMWEAELIVDDFKFDEYTRLEEKLNDKGIILTSLAEIDVDEESKKKLYELHEDIMEDVPLPDGYTRQDYDGFIERTFNHPDYFPEAYLLALKGDEFIGLSNNWIKEEQNALYTGLTGVRQEYRGKGIATAMKVKAIEVAEREGFEKIKTMNETGNEDILHINEKMGFEKKPAWVDYEKKLVEK